MLTNIYYYNNYRDQILGKTKGMSVKKSKQEQFYNSINKQQKVDDEEKSIQLNRAYNNSVLNYINDVAGVVNELKSSANALVKEFNGINKSFKYKGEEETFNILKDGIDEFVFTYNLSSDVIESDVSASKLLNDYYADVTDVLKGNSKALNELGIYFDNNKLAFNEEKFDNIPLTQKVPLLRASTNVFNTFNTNTNEILKVPLSNHLQFKSFNYYFNYKINATYGDTFKLVESGTLFDMAI